MYITGTASSYSDILTAVLTNCKGTDYTQSVGTGTTTYSGTLSNSPLFAGGCKLVYILGGDTYRVYDDGLGSFVGDYITAGTINYSTRAYSLTFATNTGDVEIQYTTGTNGANWREEINRTAQDSSGTDVTNGAREVILRNAGESGQEDIYVCLREFSNSGASFVGLQTLIRTYFNTGNSWWRELLRYTYDATNNKYKYIPHISLQNSSMTYWIFSNQNRIIIIVKVAGSIYESMLIGAGYRVSSPVLYDHPYSALGSCYDTINYTSTSSAHSFIITRNASYNVIIKPNGYEHAAFNANVYPYDTYNGIGTPTTSSNGDLVLYPVYLANNTSSYEVYQQLDGVYHVASEGIQSEDIVTISGVDYLIFQNTFRVDNYNYMAIRKD